MHMHFQQTEGACDVDSLTFPLQYYTTDNASCTEALGHLDDMLFLMTQPEVERCFDDNLTHFFPDYTDRDRHTQTAAELAPLPWMKSAAVKRETLDDLLSNAQGLVGLKHIDFNTECVPEAACTDLEMVNSTDPIFSTLPYNNCFGQDSIFFEPSLDTISWEPLWESGLGKWVT